MKIGSRVLIVDNLKELKDKGNDIVSDMLVYAGQEAIITNIYSEKEAIAPFEINVDNGYWGWYSNMIVEIE
jgi:hypothetical protein